MGSAAPSRAASSQRRNARGPPGGDRTGMDSQDDAVTPPHAADAESTGKLTGATRRTFIRDLAVAGTGTAAALYGLDAAGVADVVGEASAADALAPLADFAAIAPSAADALEVPVGISWSVVIGYGDAFSNTDGTTYRFGYNNDWIGYYPLRGSEEGLLFVNHEYPDPFFQHGFKPNKTVGSGASATVVPRENSKTTKSAADVDLEKEATGNSIVHVRRTAEGAWAVVSPSPYNRRIFGGEVPGMPATKLTFTGPLSRAGSPGSSAPDPKVVGSDNLADGSMANCSGGTTPWGTALSCEENYDGYGLTFKGSTFDFTYGWDSIDPALPRTQQQDGSYVPPSAEINEYNPTTGAASESRKYGWVCEHDPYDPAFVGRKHTALGRFRHENTAFRVARGKKFVLYMGDDQVNQGVYKFVSTRSFDPAAPREEHLRILTEGTLHVARFTPEGRRRFAGQGGALLTPTSGGGTWEPVDTKDLFDTRLRLAGIPSNESIAPAPGSPETKPTPVIRRPRQQTSRNNTDPANEATFAGRYNRLVNPSLPRSTGASDTAGSYAYLGPDPAPAGYVNEWDTLYATNRPEDVEVAKDGTVFVALTNNTSTASSGVTPPFANDAFGSVRRMNEAGNNPEATSFAWDDFAAGGSKPGAPAGEAGFASPDNLVFDSQDNIWVVTDISSSSLNRAGNPNEFHKNNAVFVIPRGDAGVAYRFANMPVQSEGTGPYFTPDESTLFLTVQHPGEEAKNTDTAILGQPATYSSFWPRGNKTTGANPSEPLPSLVAIYRRRTPATGTTPTTPTDTTTPQPTPPPVPVGPAVPAPPAPTADTTPPAVKVSGLKRTSVRALRTSGIAVTVEVDEAARLEISLLGRIRFRSGRRTRTTSTTTLGTVKRTAPAAGKVTVRIKPTVLARLQLARTGADVVTERILVEAVDKSGNVRRTSLAAVITKR